MSLQNANSIEVNVEKKQTLNESDFHLVKLLLPHYHTPALSLTLPLPNFIFVLDRQRYTCFIVVISLGCIWFALKDKWSFCEPRPDLSSLVVGISPSSRKVKARTVQRATRRRLGGITDHQVAVEVYKRSIIPGELKCIETETSHSTRGWIKIDRRVHRTPKKTRKFAP